MKLEKQPPYNLYFITGIILLIISATATWYGSVYTHTPPQLRRPQNAHEHVRLQIINNGRPINFATEAFQTPYDKYSCSVDLSKEPIHLHDNLDQFIHLHWQGITGGMVLKNYGWNEIGGKNNRLGYRFDQGLWPQAISIHGQILPQRSKKDSFFLYTGDKASHQLRDWQEFLDQNLEVFFNSPITTTPAVSEASSTTEISSMNTEYTRVNHVLGNAVLFVQSNQPSEQKVQMYFDNLIPLPESTCGG